MKKLLFFTFFCCASILLSQRKYAKEFSLVTDNDLYTSITRDGYYTSGVFLSYRYLSKFSSEKIIKRSYQFTLGQQIFSPYKSTVTTIARHDRPFAGYLFGCFSVQNFYKSNNVLQLSGQIGVIGTSAFGKETMKFIHSFYNLADPVGWKHQISNAFGLNFEGSYFKHLGSDSSKTFDISWYNTAKVGTVFTDFSSGFYVRIGFQPLQNLANSVALGGNLNNEKSSFSNTSEFFVFVKPMLSYVAYDATIEGSFLNDNSPVTYGVNPFKFSTEVGLRFTANRFNFGYSVILHSKKLKSNTKRNSFYYGSIIINYQLN